MCIKADVELVFLSSYFPDYNPIKQFFVTLKQWMQRHGDLVEEYKEDFEGYIWLVVEEYNSGKHSGAHFWSAHIGMNLTVTDDDYDYDYEL